LCGFLDLFGPNCATLFLYIINIKYYINVIIHNDNVNKLVYVRKVGPII